MTSNIKPMSAIDRIKAEDKVTPYHLTDDIVIHAPTYDQAQSMDSVEGMDAKMESWLGVDTYANFQSELGKLPVHLVEPVMLDFLTHFFGEDAGRRLAASMAKTREEVLSQFDEAVTSDD